MINQFFAEQKIKNVLKKKRSFMLHKNKCGDMKLKSKKENARRSDSDDSIGSASDLRAREEQEEIDEKEDSETMTVNDSVLTCGSSAYHAECESMAREELPPSRRYPRMADVPENIETDSLFVGHSYGDKPLLADDELDKGDAVSPAPLIDMNDEQKEAKEKDVFSMAPFKIKKRCKDINASQNDLLIAMSPNITETSLVDLGESKSYTFHTNNSNSSLCKESFDSGIFKADTVADNNPFSASFKPILVLNSTENVLKTKEDLFGAVPFNTMAVSVSNSSRNSNEIDDFINFGSEKLDDYNSVSNYYLGTNASFGQTVCNDLEYTGSTGINNMSFEDHPNNGSELMELSFSKIKQSNSNCSQLFFQPSKSNPFS
ncbi:hypothetical protein PGB90_002441 [Kerria lacca]